MLIKLISVLIIVISIIFPSFSVEQVIGGNIKDFENSFLEPPLGIEIIDIDIPEIVIKDWSNVFINVTLKNHKMIPVTATIYVFIKYNGIILKNKEKKIGLKIVKIPALSENITYTVKCFTGINWWKFLFKNQRVSNTDELFYNGEIGIKIVRGFIHFPHIITDILRVNDYFVKWTDVKLIEPIIYNPDVHPIKFEWWDIEDKTDGNGTFKVRVNISNNNKCIDIPICLVLYIVDPSIISSKKPDYYQCFFHYAGFSKAIVNNSNYSNITIQCEFPDDNFLPQYYEVTLINFYYIPTENNSNKLGERFSKWDAEKFHDEKEYRQIPQEVKNFWFELGDNVGFSSPSAPIYTFSYPRVNGNVFYLKKGYIYEYINDTIDQVTDKIIEISPIFFFIILSLIGFFCIGLWIVLKFSKFY